MPTMKIIKMEKEEARSRVDIESKWWLHFHKLTVIIIIISHSLTLSYQHEFNR